MGGVKPIGQAPNIFSHGWLKVYGSPNTPIMTGWIIGGKVHQKQSATSFTHLSIVLTLGGLTLECMWHVACGIWAHALGLSHHSLMNTLQHKLSNGLHYVLHYTNGGTIPLITSPWGCKC